MAQRKTGNKSNLERGTESERESIARKVFYSVLLRNMAP